MALFAENLACIRGERLVFRDVNFRLEAGGALVLRGPNGSGKSSLLRMLAGFLKPAAGRIEWDGAPLGDAVDSFRAELCYVGHLDAVKPVLSAAENLSLWGEEPGAALRRFGLASLAETPCRFLSAGQKRRVNLARLLLRPTRLWLLDEPTNSLDSAACDVLADVVVEHRQSGGMVLAAAHAGFDLPDTTELRLGRG